MTVTLEGFAIILTALGALLTSWIAYKNSERSAKQSELDDLRKRVEQINKRDSMLTEYVGYLCGIITQNHIRFATLAQYVRARGEDPHELGFEIGFEMSPEPAPAVTLPAAMLERPQEKGASGA